MRRRIDRELRNRLARKVSFAGVMEWITEDGAEFHIHGLIVISDDEKQRVREALRTAGGAWREGPARGVQVNLQRSYNIDYWAGTYCSKSIRYMQAEIIRRREQMGVQSSRVPRIDFSSREIQRAAKTIYEQDRKEFLPRSNPSPVRDARKSSPVHDAKKIPGTTNLEPSPAILDDATNSTEDHMGRHKEEVGTAITVRIRSKELQALDAWIERQSEEGLNRQKAIRRLIAAAISDATKPEASPVICDVNNSSVIPDTTNLEREITPDSLSSEELDALQDDLAETEFRASLAQTTESWPRRTQIENMDSPADREHLAAMEAAMADFVIPDEVIEEPVIEKI